MRIDKNARCVLYLILALAIPLCVQSVYLLCSRLPVPRWTGTTDNVASFVSLGSGLVFVLLLPCSRRLRILTAVLYLPVMIGVLFLYTICFVCAVCGDCL